MKLVLGTETLLNDIESFLTNDKVPESVRALDLSDLAKEIEANDEAGLLLIRLILGDLTQVGTSQPFTHDDLLTALRLLVNIDTEIQSDALELHVEISTLDDSGEFTHHTQNVGSENTLKLIRTRLQDPKHQQKLFAALQREALGIPHLPFRQPTLTQAAKSYIEDHKVTTADNFMFFVLTDQKLLKKLDTASFSELVVNTLIGQGLKSLLMQNETSASEKLTQLANELMQMTWYKNDAQHAGLYFFRAVSAAIDAGYLQKQDVTLFFKTGFLDCTLPEFFKNDDLWLWTSNIPTQSTEHPLLYWAKQLKATPAGQAFIRALVGSQLPENPFDVYVSMNLLVMLPLSQRVTIWNKAFEKNPSLNFDKFTTLFGDLSCFNKLLRLLDNFSLPSSFCETTMISSCQSGMLYDETQKKLFKTWIVCNADPIGRATRLVTALAFFPEILDIDFFDSLNFHSWPHEATMHIAPAIAKNWDRIAHNNPDMQRRLMKSTPSTVADRIHPLPSVIRDTILSQLALEQLHHEIHGQVLDQDGTAKALWAMSFNHQNLTTSATSKQKTIAKAHLAQTAETIKNITLSSPLFKDAKGRDVAGKRSLYLLNVFEHLVSMLVLAKNLLPAQTDDGNDLTCMLFSQNKLMNKALQDQAANLVLVIETVYRAISDRTSIDLSKLNPLKEALKAVGCFPVLIEQQIDRMQVMLDHTELALTLPQHLLSIASFIISQFSDGNKTLTLSAPITTSQTHTNVRETYQAEQTAYHKLVQGSLTKMSATDNSPKLIRLAGTDRAVELHVNNVDLFDNIIKRRLSNMPEMDDATDQDTIKFYIHGRRDMPTVPLLDFLSELPQLLAHLNIISDGDPARSVDMTSLFHLYFRYSKQHDASIDNQVMHAVLSYYDDQHQKRLKQIAPELHEYAMRKLKQCRHCFTVDGNADAAQKVVDETALSAFCHYAHTPSRIKSDNAGFKFYKALCRTKNQRPAFQVFFKLHNINLMLSLIVYTLKSRIKGLKESTANPYETVFAAIIEQNAMLKTIFIDNPDATSAMMLALCQAESGKIDLERWTSLVNIAYPTEPPKVLTEFLLRAITVSRLCKTIIRHPEDCQPLARVFPLLKNLALEIDRGINVSGDERQTVRTMSDDLKTVLAMARDNIQKACRKLFEVESKAVEASQKTQEQVNLPSGSALELITLLEPKQRQSLILPLLKSKATAGAKLPLLEALIASTDDLTQAVIITLGFKREEDFPHACERHRILVKGMIQDMLPSETQSSELPSVSKPLAHMSSKCRELLQLETMRKAVCTPDEAVKAKCVALITAIHNQKGNPQKLARTPDILKQLYQGSLKNMTDVINYLQHYLAVSELMIFPNKETPQFSKRLALCRQFLDTIQASNQLNDESRQILKSLLAEDKSIMLDDTFCSVDQSMGADNIEMFGQLRTALETLTLKYQSNLEKTIGTLLGGVTSLFGLEAPPKVNSQSLTVVRRQSGEPGLFTPLEPAEEEGSSDHQDITLPRRRDGGSGKG
jgi:hypothetical protein